MNKISLFLSSDAITYMKFQGLLPTLCPFLSKRQKASSLEVLFDYLLFLTFLQYCAQGIPPAASRVDSTVTPLVFYIQHVLEFDEPNMSFSISNG